MEAIRLFTGNLTLEFSALNGALIGMKAEDTGWVIHRRPELGLSWQLHVPLSEQQKFNPIYGEKQKLAGFEQGEDFVRFVWKNVVSERAGMLDIEVHTEVRAEKGRAVWYTHLVNRSCYTIETAANAMIGDLTAPAGGSAFETYSTDYAAGQTAGIYPVFNGNKGDWGIEHPIYYAPAAPYNTFVLLKNEEQGLYAGVGDLRGEIVAFFNELLPGYTCAMDNLVPEGDEIQGMPVCIRFGALHTCLTEPGEETALTPIVWQAYRGGTNDGVKAYRAWRDGLETPHKRPDWICEPHSWLQIQMNSPVDDLRYRFTDLPRIAADCVKNGITAIQLVGWNKGGQDQGNPCHDPDPRLGTVAEFKKALAECRAMGIKMILFSKFTWADMGEPEYETTYKNYAIRDKWGNVGFHGGYQYYTPSQYMGLSTKRLAPMCFGAEKYMEACVREFKKVVSYGCDGILYDECQHHNGALMCFSKEHGHKPGWSVYKNDNELIRRFRSVEGLPEGFAFCGEACYDLEFGQYDLAYFRSRSRGHVPGSRMMRPDVPMMTAVCAFRERNMINQCLKDRYIISYEPDYFKGLPSRIPETVAYGRRIDALRTRERKYLWDGEFCGTTGASVTDENGSALSSFSRFEAADGTSALVICNYEDKPVTVKAAAEKGTLREYTLADDGEFRPFDGKLTLPARSAAVIK